jgi:hypothetical protein
MVLEHCLLAAKATGDRTAEAWALHEIGSRAICVGETRGARSALSDALKLRESAAERDAAAASRNNLGFVLAPAFELASEPAQAIDERFEFDSLPLQDAIGPAVGTVTRRRHSMLPAVACVMAMLAGGLAFWAAAPASLLPMRRSASSAAPTAPAARTWSEASVHNAPMMKPAAQAPSILIFSPRPGSFATGPTKLCYAVAGAVSARVEPGIGDVAPTSSLTCLRVAPARTTTYQLTALGRNGNQVRQQLVIVVK